MHSRVQFRICISVIGSDRNNCLLRLADFLFSLYLIKDSLSKFLIAGHNMVIEVVVA